MNFKPVRFSHNRNPDIMTTLRARVNEYFDTNNINRYGNSEMVWKTIIMLSAYIIPYSIIISGSITNSFVIFGLWLIMGLGMVGIGLAIMHDANHGSFSRKPAVNKSLGYLINLIGGNSVNWKIQHNVLHHSFTNIDGLDEDIDMGRILRFSPAQKRYKFHKLQHYYAWFFYSFLTLNWVISKDFFQIFRYRKLGLIKSQNKSFAGSFAELLISKAIYVFYFVVLPMILVPIPWWETLIYFLCMHLIAGFLVAIIFQCAHVVPSSEYPLPDDKGNMDTTFTVHQLLTTANFSPKNRLLSSFIGGLNFQIEHHLFPNICHVHYRHISKIVKETSHEYGIPYNVYPNFLKAIRNHVKMLRDLGRYD